MCDYFFFSTSLFSSTIFLLLIHRFIHWWLVQSSFHSASRKMCSTHILKCMLCSMCHIIFVHDQRRRRRHWHKNIKLIQKRKRERERTSDMNFGDSSSIRTISDDVAFCYSKKSGCVQLTTQMWNGDFYLWILGCCRIMKSEWTRFYAIRYAIFSLPICFLLIIILILCNNVLPLRCLRMKWTGTFQVRECANTTEQAHTIY